ncbi:recombinase family protein [Halobacillus sp. SY10]|uniref:recombinase family protein n=1 Tax=Halobacillus sp. SY10 TaxID=3381356 RepID=UPI003879DDC8
MRVAIYVRVSTLEQATEGFSLRAQEEKLRAFALSQDWEVAKIYRDEGESAKDLNRPKLKELLRDVERDLIDVVLVYRLDRLTRSVVDLYELLETLDKNQCSFKSATEVYDTTSATGRLFITLVAAMAQWERENLAERVRFGMERRLMEGGWSGGPVPYGYTYHEGTFKIVPEEAKVVEKVFELIAGRGINSVARMLNDMGYKTRSGDQWRKDAVHYIARNPFYIGKFRFNEGKDGTTKPFSEQTLYEGPQPKIIDDSTFAFIQEVLEKRAGQKKIRWNDYIFSGVLRCSRCSSPIVGTKSKGKKRYRCTGNSNGCKMIAFTEEHIEGYFLSNYDNFIKGVMKEATEVDSDHDDIEKQIQFIQRRMKKYKDMYLNDLISIEELNANINELRQKEKDLEAQAKPKTASNPVVVNLAYDLPELWKGMNDEEKKMLVNTIFEKIIVNGDEKAGYAPGRPKPIWFESIQ